MKTTTPPSASPTPQVFVVLEDLLIEILSRLPVKSLLRFRCVSKSWHSLIGHKINNKKLPPAMLGLFVCRSFEYSKEFISLKSRTYIDPSSVDTSLSFIPSSPSSPLYIASCCNGLLLLNDDSRESPNPNMYVCNPATRYLALIPKPTPYYTNLALAFDPTCCGFKILSLPGFHHHLVSTLVFSSKTGEWTDFQPTHGQSDLDLLLYSRTEPDFTFLNGVLYTVTRLCRCLLAFDLERNLCKRIQLVEPISRIPHCPWNYRCIGQNRGRMHLAVTVDLYLYVFVLEVDEFFLKHQSGLHAVLMKFAGRFRSDKLMEPLRVIAFHQDLDLVFLKLGMLIISYHLLSGEADEVDNIRGCNYHHVSWVAYTPCYIKDLDLLEYSTN